MAIRGQGDREHPSERARLPVSEGAERATPASAARCADVNG
jgi:hypothetical protein